MTDQSPNLESLFLAALEITSPEERAAFLDQACKNDRQLRADVEKMLAAQPEIGSFLESPLSEFDATIVPGAAHKDLAASLEAGLAPAFGADDAVVLGDAGHSVLRSLANTLNEVPRVALRESEAEGPDPITRPSSPEVPKSDSDSRYQLQGEIARGGMGAIIKGRDTDLGRDLAIKVLLDSHKDKPEVIQRFVEEAQIGGQLQHPGIAPIYELGQFKDKRPFFAMKLVKGQTLSKLLADREDASEDRGKFIGIFEQVCQTMAYAHSRGVIHRDLKPANIMVGAFGEVQVMDWGLAKVLQAGGVADEKKSLVLKQGVSIIATLRSGAGSDSPGIVGSVGSQTQMGSVMGTPAYMPPEQALGEVDRLDERSDVFGLGAILCEILTGQPPYVGTDRTAVYRQASRGKLDDAISRLDACGADEDLITLVKHCLELEPTERPRDAGVLARRVTEHLESVEIRLRAAEVEHAAQAARADAEAAQAAAERNRAEAESQRAEAQAAKAQAESARANEEHKRRRTSLALAASMLLLIGLGSGGWLYMERQEANRQTAEADSQRQHAADMSALADQRDEQRKAAELARLTAEVAQQQADAEKINSLNMLADMQTERGLLAGREHQSATAALWFANAAALTPHDLDRQQANQLRAASWLNEAIAPVALLKASNGFVTRFAFQPGDALALTVSSEGQLRIWDWRNEVDLPWSRKLAFVSDAIWSPDGRQLAVGFDNGDVHLYDPSSGTLQKHFQYSERVAVLHWSPDGTRLAVGGMRVQIWNVAAEPALEADWLHPERVYGLSFNRAGTQLVTSCADDFARVYAVGDASESALLYPPIEHVPYRRGALSREARRAVFFDEDRRLVTLAKSSRAPVLRDALSGQPVKTAWGDFGEPVDLCIAISPDGRWVAASGEKAVYLLGADGRRIELRHRNEVEYVSFTPDGQSLVSTCWDGTARWWPLQDLSSSSPVVGLPIAIPQMGTTTICALSPVNSSLAIIDKQQIAIWERPQKQSQVKQIAWSDYHWRPRVSFDERFVTPGALHETSILKGLPPRSNTLLVARMADGQAAGPPITLNGLLFDSCVCADNCSVAAATVNGSAGILTVYDIASGAILNPVLTLPDLPISVAARPGHSEIAVLCLNGELLVIDTTDGQTRMNLSHEGWTGQRTIIARTAYSSDGATLLTITPNHLLFVRDANGGELRFPVLQPVLEGGPLRTIAFSRDSRLLATAVNGRNMLQVWDLKTGERTGREMPHPGDHSGLWSVEFSRDGEHLLTGHKDGRARIWDWKSGELTGPPMQHPDEVFDARFTPDGRHVICAVRWNTIFVWDIATAKLAVSLPNIPVEVGQSTRAFGIGGDHVAITAGRQYSILDLSALLQKPTDDLSTLLTRAELATNQKQQLGQLVSLEQHEWLARWEQLVAARRTPEEEAQSSARERESAP